MANDNIIRFTKLSESLNTTLSKQIGVLEKAATNLNTLNKSYGKLPSDYYKAVKQGLEIEKKKAQVDKELITLEQKKTDLVAKAERAEKAKIQTKQASLRLSQQEQAAKKRNTKLTLEETEALKKSNREARQVAQIKNTTAGSIDNLKAKLALVTNAWSKLTAKEIENTKRGKRLAASKKQLTAELLRLEKATGNSTRQVGAYEKRLGGLRSGFINLSSAMGVTLGLFGAFRLIKNSVSIVRDFEKQNATLAGVLQKTKEEIVELTEDAKRLGSTTVKTAGEVAGLQTEYARLGFTQQEILDLTEATIQGSVAMNSGLSETAQLVGAVVNSYDDLAASDSQMIIDTLSLATAKSALSFEKLNTALPIVSGAANAIGVPLTEVTATLGKLADAGIDASSGATALRNIYIESAKEGIDYKDALLQITKSTDKLATANDLFGKRAAVSALIIANNTENVEELDIALQNAAGTAETMAENELNTLDGSIKLLVSAWEGFVLKLNDATNGGNALSVSVRFLAENLETIFKWVGIGTAAWVSYKVALMATNLATKAGIIWTKASTIATGIKTGALNAATAAQKAFNAASKANIIGAVIALLAAATAAYYAFKDSVYESTKALKRMEEQMNETSKAQIELQIKLLDEQEKAIKESAKNEEEANKKSLDLLNEYEKKVIAGTADLYSTKEELAKIDSKKQAENAEKEQEELQKNLNKKVLSYEEAAKLIEKTGGKFRIPTEQDGATDYKKLSEAQLKVLEEIEKRRNALQKQSTELDKKENEKKLRELANYLKKLQDLQDGFILDAEEREIAQTKRKFNREIEDIKGNSKVERELRAALEKQMLTEIIEISNKYRDIEQKLQEAHNKEVEDAETESLDERYKNAKEFFDKIMALEKQTKEFQESFKSDLASKAGFSELNDMFLTLDENGKSMFENLMEGADGMGERMAVAFNAISEVAQQAFNTIQQSSRANFENEYAILEERKETAIRFAGESTAARERIEEQYEEKKNQIRIREAKAKKKLAKMNAIIDTAQAVVSTLATTPYPANIAFAAIIAGMGAFQISTIDNQEIPQFKDGVRGFEGGLAIVGDGGVSEVIKTKDGVYSTPNKDTLVNLPKGADVIPSHEEYYNNVMGELGVLPSAPKVEVNGGITKTDLDRVIGKHFKNIKTNNTTIDKNGFSTFVQTQNAKKKLLNNRTNFNGLSV